MQTSYQKSRDHWRAVDNDFRVRMQARVDVLAAENKRLRELARVVAAGKDHITPAHVVEAGELVGAQ